MRIGQKSVTGKNSVFFKKDFERILVALSTKISRGLRTPAFGEVSVVVVGAPSRDLYSFLVLIKRQPKKGG